jgi:chemotaxis family two-component system sensor histidine kinase/response regulator PixL
MPQNEEKKESVLVVEDDLFLVKTFQIRFEKMGFEVIIARDGRDAIGLLDREPAKLVVLDLMLPSVNGFDVLSAIRANPHWKDVPVVVLTNLGQAQDMERCKKLGATEYYVKSSVKINDLMEKLDKYLD